MKVQTRLYISLIISIGLVGILFFVVYLTSSKINEEIKTSDIASDMHLAVSELDIVTYEYLMHHEKRMEEQWSLKYNSTAEILEKSIVEEKIERELMESIRKDYTTLGDLFLKLTANYNAEQKLIQEGAPPEKIDSTMLLEERLTAQLLIKSQSIIADVSTLENEAFLGIIKAQELTRNSTLLLMVVLTITVTTTSVLVSRSISKPLDKLTKGVEIIGKGNLKHRIDVKSKDEIGQLADAFNIMTSELEELYGSLEKKVKERTFELEAAKNKSETILASVGDGVFGINKEQNIIYFNKKAEEISGYKASEVLRKPYYDVLRFVKVKDKSENIEFIRRALKGEVTEMADHTVLIRKDKREVPVADSASPIKDKEGNILGAVIVFRDASKEKALERARAELISFASHQLKSPLTYMNWNVAMLKERKIDKESRQLIGEVEKAIEVMNKLVSDVLNISRIEQGKIKFTLKPTQLEEVVDDIVKESSSLVKQRKINIEFIKPSRPLPEFEIDPQYIHEVFKNIISNAIKYTKDTVTISFEKKDGNILFVCSDNGIGIPKDEQSKIFNKFYVASNVPEVGIKGTGLGLSIAKALVERMNGRIWFESKENKGTTFYISLPFLV